MRKMVLKMMLLLYVLLLHPKIGNTAELTGRFLYNGQPVVGLRVFALQDNAELTGFEISSTTDDNGIFYFKDLAAGDYVIRTFGSHSNTYYCTVEGFFGTKTKPVSLQQNGRYKLEDLVLQKEFGLQSPLAGQILTAGRPVYSWDSFWDAEYFGLKIFDINGQLVYESSPIYGFEYQGTVLEQGL